MARTSKRGRDTLGKPKRSGRGRLGIFILTLFIVGLSIGFVSFAQHVDGLRTEVPPERADGIVVWTGKGGGRLEKAGELLRADFGERLLISGVNDQVKRAELTELTGVSEELSNCCVDLDYAAQDTRGNARETAAWARALGYDEIILVTSAYHMPRARVEIGQEAGRIRILPVAVTGGDARRWWQSGERFRRLVGEYGKYLLSLARGRSEQALEGELVLPSVENEATQSPPATE